MRKYLAATVLLVLLAVLGTPATLRAQGALAYGSVAAAVSGDTTSAAYGGGGAWRFNRAFGLGVELSHIPSLDSDFPRIFCCGEDSDMSVTTFTTNVRLEVPTTSSRIIPFVMAGGGVAAVTQSYSVIYAQLANPIDLRAIGLNTVPILPQPSDLEYTNTNMALTLGGGASFLLGNHFAIDADLRLLHVMGNDSRNIGRFGGGVSYRF
jgi:opacity protein-like surface antigen